MHTDPNCIFCKIVAGKIPSKKVYEDDELFAFHDINPWAPVHFLIIPKAHIPSLAQAKPEHAAMLGRMMVLVPGLEFLGYSRLGSVEHCAEVAKVADWTALTTDSELEGMEACLVDLT